VNQAAAAFAAGIVSFATPCVLPLVPAYLSAIGANATDPGRALRAAAPFVLGFSAVFVALGVAVGLAGSIVTDHRLELIHLEPVVGAAAGWLLLGESAAIGQVAGATAVLIGIAVSTLPARAPAACAR